MIKTLYLGLDVSTTFTGICAYNEKDYIYEGIVCKPEIKTKKEQKEGINYNKIEHPLCTYNYYDNSDENVHENVKKFMKVFDSVISKIIEGYDVVKVGIENYAFAAKGKNAHKLIVYGYEVRKYFYDKGIEYKNLHIQGIKKNFLEGKTFTDNKGKKRRSNKTDMIKRFFEVDNRFLIDNEVEYTNQHIVVFPNLSKRLKLEDIADCRAMVDFVFKFHK